MKKKTKLFLGFNPNRPGRRRKGLQPIHYSGWNRKQRRAGASTESVAYTGCYGQVLPIHPTKGLRTASPWLFLAIKKLGLKLVKRKGAWRVQ